MDRHQPGSEHPHVQEGICTCPDGGAPGRYVTTCGRSAHRVQAYGWQPPAHTTHPEARHGQADPTPA